MTSDVGAPVTPQPIYDTATADTLAGEDSNAGKMMAAALSVSQGVRVDVVGKSEGWVSDAPNFFPIDVSGQSGYFLTLSKNGGDFITFNLSDPDFDKLAFEQFVSYGESGLGFAFMGYPLMDREQSNLEPWTGVCGFTIGGKAVTPTHPNGQDPHGVYLGNKLASLPFDITIESTVLTAKATPNVAKETDMFYSIDGAVEGGTVSAYSKAVIKFDGI